MSATATATATVTSSTPVATTQIGPITIYDDYVHHLESVPEHSHPKPFLLQKYIDQHVKSGSNEHQDLFVYEKGCQFQLQLRTGPLVHREFHTQGGEEWYYVTQGEALIKFIDGCHVKEFPLTVGTCFLIPAGMPKSLQICSGGTVLVMTRQRKTATSYPHYNKLHTVPQLTHLNHNAKEPNDPLDSLIWLCHSCGGIAHQEQFECTEYYTQTSALISIFDSSAASGKIQCQSCQTPYPVHDSTHLTHHEPLPTIASIERILKKSAVTQLPSTAPAFPTLNHDTHPPPYHLFSWIESNKHKLLPPVCNSMIHSRGCDWKVMIVGGPNERTDYHIDDGEEWFLMIKGDMNLKLVDKKGTEFRDCIIKEGESFLLPANVPHSPQRFANTIGLVIERERFSYELDGLRWWCKNPECRQILRTFSFRCEDLGTQLKTLINYWYEDTQEGLDRRTCKKCGHIETKPVALDQIKHFTH